MLGQRLDLVGHAALVGVALGECVVAGQGRAGLPILVVGGTGERRVHDDEVERVVGELGDHVADFVFALAAGGDAAPEAVLRVGGEQGERADAGVAIAFAGGGIVRGALPAVGHGEQAFALEGDAGLGAGEHGGGEVDRAGDDVEADQSVFHHRRVEGGWVAGVEFVEQGDALVGGGEQGAGAAGEVADLERGERVGVLPVSAAGGAVARHGDAGEQRGGGGPRIEGGEDFAVGDEPLEDGAGEVVRAGRAALDQLARGGPERFQHRGGRVGGHRPQHLGGFAEDRAVVLRHHAFPLVEQRVDVESVEGAELAQGADGPAAAVDVERESGAGEGFVEDERVGDHRHRHHAGLAVVVVFLLQDVGDARADRVEAVVVGGVADGGGEQVGEAVDAPDRDCGAVDEHGEFARVAADVAAGGEALGVFAVAVGVEREAEVVGAADGVRQLAALEFSEAGRIDERDRGFDGVPCALDLAVHALERIVVDFVARRDFGFDHDGPAGRIGDEQVGREACAVFERAGRFGEHGPAVAAPQGPEHVAELDVDLPFARACHARRVGRTSRPGAPVTSVSGGRPPSAAPARRSGLSRRCAPLRCL